MNITEERKKIVLFSNPYMEVGQSIIIQPNNTAIKTFDDLKDKVIGVQQGSVSDEYITSRKDSKEIKKYAKVADALQDLSAGRVQAVVTDNVVGAYYMKVDPSKYVMLDALYDAGVIGIAIPMG